MVASTYSYEAGSPAKDSGTTTSGKTTKLLNLQKPASPDSIAVTKDNSLVIYYGNSFYDTHSRKTVALPQSNHLLKQNNTLFITSKKGTYLIVGS